MKTVLSCLAMMLASAIVLLLETVFFHVLVYLSSYIQASSIISVALLGIALGGIAAFWFTGRGYGVLSVCSSLAGIATVACIFSLLFLPQYLEYPLLLVLPFLLCSVVIAALFGQMRKHIAYFWNLAGAALGVVLVCVLVPMIFSENVILVGIIMCGVLALILATMANRKFFPSVLALAILAAGIGGLAWNLKTREFDFATKARSNPSEKDRTEKAFDRIRERADTELAYARDSLVGRVDVLKRDRGNGRYNLGVFQEAVASDIVEPRPVGAYEWDCRIPKPLVPEENPSILVIGTSAEGVTKTGRLHSKENMVGIEINPAIVHLMYNELYEYSKRAYEGIELHVTDARTYLEGVDRQFDVITMMNTHTRGRVSENAGLPQYLFTEEAFTLMFERLTDRGVILLEEVLVNEESEDVLKRILASLIAGLRSQGIEKDFEDHFYGFRFRGKFFLLAAKKQPFTKEELSTLDAWMERRAKIKRAKHPVDLHPERENDNVFARFLRDPEAETLLAQAGRDVDITSITDNKPFLYDIDPAHPRAWRILKVSALATAVLILLPSIFLFLVRSPIGTLSRGAGLLLYFALIGVGFMLVEIVLMQKYQLYLGSPVYSLIVVLTSILLFSGIGSLVSGRFSDRGRKACILAIPILLQAFSFGLPYLFAETQSLPLSARVAVAVATLFPLFFCMGAPFPYGLALVAERFPAGFVGLLYGVNGAFGTLGVALSMLISVQTGFVVTFYLGISLYCAAFLAIVRQRLGNPT